MAMLVLGAAGAGMGSGFAMAGLGLGIAATMGAFSAAGSLPFADLDLVIMDPAPLTPQQHLDLKDAFENSALPIKVDVVPWHSLSPTLKENIQKQHGVIQAGAQ